MDSNPESKWTEKMNDIRQGKRFAKVFKFSGDSTAFSDDGEFGLNFKEIYNPEFALKKKNFCKNKGFFWTYLLKLKIIKFPSSSMIREMIVLFL